jgi:hypothetical protein
LDGLRSVADELGQKCEALRRLHGIAPRIKLRGETQLGDIKPSAWCPLFYAQEVEK